MSASKNIDKICAVITAVTLLIAIIFCSGIGIESAARTIGYENRIFDKSKVHTIDIVMNNWDEFIGSCENEEYVSCTAVIDGEAVGSVGLRAKGNTSLRNVSSMGSSRYSFKIEFDHYDSSKSYHGLDKLCLNNIIQDNTYMKDYLAYTLMADFGVPSPLCSYAYITVNGEDWGLYLAVEAVEDSFLQRACGGSGELYKPDSADLGGGQGYGRNFHMSDFMEREMNAESGENSEKAENPGSPGSPAEFPVNLREQGEGMLPGMGKGMPENPGGNLTNENSRGGMRNTGGMGSSDVKLQYIDDDPDSYPNIFDNAKTDITKADKARLISSLKTLTEQAGNAGAIESVVDADRVIRYFAVHNFLCNGDSYTGQMIHNYYLHEREGRLSMIPWDYNLAFGGFGGGSGGVNDPIDSPVSGDMSDRPMINWIFENEEYRSEYHALLGEFIGTDFDSVITDAAALISEYVEKDPTKFCTYEEFEKGVSALKTFCALRAESISGQLSGAIPSDSDGQKADSSALIDDSGLNVSDMGGMGGNMQPFEGGMGGRPQMPDEFKGNGSFKGANADNGGNVGNGANAGNDEDNGNFTDINPPGDFSEFARPDNFAPPSSDNNVGNSEMTAGSDISAPSDGMRSMGSRPENGGYAGVSSEMPGENQIPLLIISAAVLVIGIAAAALFKC